MTDRWGRTAGAVVVLSAGAVVVVGASLAYSWFGPAGYSSRGLEAWWSSVGSRLAVSLAWCLSSMGAAVVCVGWAKLSRARRATGRRG